MLFCVLITLHRTSIQEDEQTNGQEQEQDDQDVLHIDKELERQQYDELRY